MCLFERDERRLTTTINRQKYIFEFEIERDNMEDSNKKLFDALCKADFKFSTQDGHVMCLSLDSQGEISCAEKMTVVDSSTWNVGENFNHISHF